MRKLGDVPGLSEILARDGQVAPVSLVETLGIDAASVDALGIGDMGAMGGSGDPFSMAAAQQRTAALSADEEVGEGRGPVDPMESSYLPSGASETPSSTSTPSSSSVSGGPPSSSGLDTEQMDNVRAIIEVAEEVGADDRDIQVAIMAGIVESGLRNLDYGDRDSIGMFQQRDAWGSAEDRLDPRKAARMFFKGGAAGQRGLLDIEGRESMGLGEQAQAVQVSAFPERYAEHEAEAESLLAQAKSTSAAGGIVKGEHAGHDPYEQTQYSGKTVDHLTAAALEKASEIFGREFPVTQGSYNHGGVAASGGTHDGGGVVDIILDTDEDYDQAVAALRKVGFAAWDRHEEEGPWPRHIHAVLGGHEKLAPAAAQQWESYLNNDAGLVGSGMDTGPRDWVGVKFEWGKEVAEANPEDDFQRQKVVKRAKDFIGTPFKWGGEDFTGVDAGGFVRNVYKELGVDLSKDGLEIPFASEPVPIENAQLGDLIAWDPRTGNLRMGVYLGDGTVLSADGPGSGVRVNSIADVTDAWSIPVPSLLTKTTPTTPSPRPTARGYEVAAPPPVTPTTAAPVSAAVGATLGAPKPKPSVPAGRTIATRGFEE